MAYLPFINCSRKKNTANLRKNGTIFIHYSNLDEALKSCKDLFVKLYIDEERKFIGIEFEENKSLSDCARKVQKERNGIAFTVKRILNYFNINAVSGFKLSISKEERFINIDISELFNSREK